MQRAGRARTALLVLAPVLVVGLGILAISVLRPLLASSLDAQRTCRRGLPTTRTGFSDCHWTLGPGQQAEHPVAGAVLGVSDSAIAIGAAGLLAAWLILVAFRGRTKQQH